MACDRSGNEDVATLTNGTMTTRWDTTFQRERDLERAVANDRHQTVAGE